ncbi:hypothetical protein HHK36_010168 [Tetracentron sinense]|uniref:Inositol-pentakisphosphate 2-kinase n=1 Tax=Tetracentron sinense TaxID=13715 RepID=A0A834ZE43_TETSI|nr:hypothetical protein HHK36_010168 [Tetracentron sinense]
MEVVLEGKDAVDWIYRGEGAANLVLGYTGSSPAFIGKIIRIQKAPRSRSQRMTGSPILSIHECLLWRDTNELGSSTSKEIVGQLFVLYVMSSFLGSEHVDAGIRILVSREFLESVEKNTLCQRPASRVQAARVNTLCDSALLVSDHSAFPHGKYRLHKFSPMVITSCVSILKEEPCISVEIKPKCGFLPCSKFIVEGNAIKRSVTRFRMHQVLKLHQGEISQVSEYDPLDLFSGSSNRVHDAIKALFTSPQNNFRVFLNGSLIFGGLGGGSDNTSNSISEALEDLIEGVIQADHGLRTSSFLQLVAETVFRSGVLNRLLGAQKLDMFDIEGAIHAYYNIVAQPCKVCRDFMDEELSHRYAPLHSISLEESLKIVRDYLIAATAKDCSLMISFRLREDGDPGPPDSTVYLEPTSQIFDYKAYFIDLDMKPLKKMVHYYELDQRIVSCYTQMLKTER